MVNYIGRILLTDAYARHKHHFCDESCSVSFMHNWTINSRWFHVKIEPPNFFGLTKTRNNALKQFPFDKLVVYSTFSNILMHTAQSCFDYN